MKLKNNVSIDTLLKEYKYSQLCDDAQLLNIKIGLILGYDASLYAAPKFNFRQMDTILSGMSCGIDVTKYADSRYTLSQMYSIKSALIKGIGVTPYITFDTAPMTINLIAKSLCLEKNNHKKTSFIIKC